MGDNIYFCIASCQNNNKSDVLVGNVSFDLECIAQCSQRQTTLQRHTAEKYIKTHIR
jgi:hypothetical protein